MSTYASHPSSLSRSKAGEAYGILQMDILRGKLAPDKKLTFAMLRENYPFGTAPLREALVRLVAMGLVQGEEQKGFRVAPISKADLLDLTKTSIRLETDAISSAIENATKIDDIRLLTSFHHLETLSLTGSVGSPEFEWEWNAAHAHFHESLVAACSSPSLLRLRRIIYEQSERYRCLSIGISVGSRDLNAEHRALMTAVLQRDCAQAQELVAEHWNRTAQFILDLSDLPDR